MREVVNYAEGKSFETVKHRYKRIKYSNYIIRFKQYLENNGTRYHKFEEITKYVMNEFRFARERALSVHEVDLKRWGLNKAREINFTEFTASNRWLSRLKNGYNIVSRKITHFVTNHHVHEQETINANAKHFVEETNSLIVNYEMTNIFNTDQSGFNYEMVSKRTLSVEGEKTTFGLIKSKSAVTHSYTIQPLISMTGKLLSPLYICLKENCKEDGKFGPIVSQNLFEASNIYLTCSSSGKLTKNLVKDFYESVLLQNLNENNLLILDSWSGQTDEAMANQIITSNKRLKICIPPKTTPLVQPLDVYFFRQYKILARKVYERVNLDSIEVDLHERNSIIKLHSLIYNQLQSPQFENMIKSLDH